MSPQDWDEYHQQQANILLDPDGTNKLAKATGLNLDPASTKAIQPGALSAISLAANHSRDAQSGWSGPGALPETRWKIDPNCRASSQGFRCSRRAPLSTGWRRLAQTVFLMPERLRKETNGVRINGAGRPLTKEELPPRWAAL